MQSVPKYVSPNKCHFLWGGGPAPPQIHIPNGVSLLQPFLRDSRSWSTDRQTYTQITLLHDCFVNEKEEEE